MINKTRTHILLCLLVAMLILPQFVIAQSQPVGNPAGDMTTVACRPQRWLGTYIPDPDCITASTFTRVGGIVVNLNDGIQDLRNTTTVGRVHDMGKVHSVHIYYNTNAGLTDLYSAVGNAFCNNRFSVICR